MTVPEHNDTAPIRAVAETYMDATCPLPGCGAPLYIEWRASKAVYLTDTAADLADPAGAHSSSWEIVCQGGHTVLVPPDTAEDDYTFGACRSAPEACDRDADDCGHGDMTRFRALVNAPGEQAIRDVLAALPGGHHERPGLIRALELIRWGSV